MFYVALAADFDGTLAHDERVEGTTVDALRWVKDQGKTLILVTGRELPQLQALFPEIGLFDAVVAENGALLFLPRDGVQYPLAPEPPADLVARLRDRGVEPLSVGRSVVATWTPNEVAVLEVVRELGLEWQIIFNKGAVMCLPPGVNKASGLSAALKHLKLSPLNVIAVGDAENDHAFLQASGFAVAVANALDSVKQTADMVTRADHGGGVRELIEAWLGDGHEAFGATVERHGVLLGEAAGKPTYLYPARHTVLIAGRSGGGKSRVATTIIEHILAAGAQLLVIDPEGDYDTLTGMARLGTPERAPSIDEVVTLLDDPGSSVLVGLLGLDLHERPGFMALLTGALSSLRARAARPHWMLIDESHHFLPAAPQASPASASATAPGSILLTVEPGCLPKPVLLGINMLIGVGANAGEVVVDYCRAAGRAMPDRIPSSSSRQEVLLWNMADEAPILVTIEDPIAEHKRHVRKYAEGELSKTRSFYFKGPHGKLNLRARNLLTFVELAEGVDDETWRFHLERGDYSRWLRECIDDEELADEVSLIEQDAARPEAETRKLVAAAIQRRYTAPA